LYWKTGVVNEDGIDWGGSGRAPTAAEAEFAAELEALLPGLDYWLHADADEAPWLLVSTDFVVANWVRDTLRLDFDTAGVRGGWSPAFLNWDDGVRAETAGIDVAGPDGIRVSATDQSPSDLARAAAQWFVEHQRRWPVSERAARWSTRP
jgi:hypothetical protein